MKNQTTFGHVAVIFTNIVWGTTFISTKLLLEYFDPIEILFIRTVIGFLALCAAYPHRMKITDRKQELIFALAGLTGSCMYFLLENIALTYTMASNVGVILAVAPCFTAMMMHLFFRGEEKLQWNFFAGFLVAMIGICFISFNGSKLQLNSVGDILAVLAALVWALYAVQVRKISSFGYHTIQNTRRIFAYGLFFMIILAPFFDISIQPSDFAHTVCIFNLLYLGLGASALCFVTWNFGVKVLGAVKTSLYIYMGPIVTVLTSMIVLHEKITLMAAMGTCLTLAGLIISEGLWRNIKKIKTSDLCL